MNTHTGRLGRLLTHTHTSRLTNLQIGEERQHGLLLIEANRLGK